jgi:hypothetical protein
MPQPHESSQNPIDANQNFLINQIASGLATTTELIQSLSSEIRDNAVELAIIKTDLTNVTKDVRTLSKILREGNGTAPVLSRIAVLETTATQLSTSLASLDNKANSNKGKVEALAVKTADLASTKNIDAEDKKSRRQALMAIVTSIIALIAAILVALIG